MRINLVAVQAKMQLADYASFDAFNSKVRSLMERAMRTVDPALPTLVAFPEYLGMYLGFVPYYWDDVRHEKEMHSAVAKIMRKNEARLGETLSAAPREAAQQVLFVDHAVETERAYMDTFSVLAREHRVYMIAGSLCVPHMDESPHRGGRFLLDDNRVYNQSYLFSRRGLCLGRVSKVNIPPGEDALIDGATFDRLLPARTRMGCVGTLLCWDGYHHRSIEHYDSLGVEVVVQLGYFGSPEVRFDGSGSVVPRPWDFVSLIQGRECIQYGVGAFMVGAVFEDKRAEGLSFIARNTGTSEAPWEGAIVARADDPYAETIVAAAVELEFGR